MSQQFVSEARELWQTVSSPETAKSYQQVFSLTWTILQRLGKTLWLGLCLLLVGADWVGSTAIATGRSVRTRVQSLQAVKSEELASETGQRMLDAGKVGVVNAIANARQQLGLTEKPTMFALLASASDTEDTTTVEVNPVEVSKVEGATSKAQATTAPSAPTKGT